MGEKETATAGRLFPETGNEGDGPEEAEGTIVKSKSNITNNREADDSPDDDAGARTSNLNLSKSNRTTAPVAPEPAESANLNLSKSN